MSDKTTKKEDFWCVVALDEGGMSWIVQRSEDARLCDLMPECSTEDNGVAADWEAGRSPGLYHLLVSPCCGGPDINGEYWSEIDVTAVTPLHVLTTENVHVD